MPKSTLLMFAVVATSIASVAPIAADERRAPAPKYTPGQLRGVFFENLEDAFRGPRPTLSNVRKSAAAVAAAPASSSESVESGGADLWSPLISPTSLEDEVKRVKLHFDTVVTTPGAFNSGGYQDARLDLTILATLFAVIHQHTGEVRWKDQAAAARDLIARTAFNSKAGSTQVYNEAKLRKGDLQDLVSGGGLSKRDAEPETDWTMVADRSPLMEYADLVIETLEDSTRDEASIKRDPELVKRNIEILAMLGEVFVQEGMDDADDDDYVKFSQGMREVAKTANAAIDRMDFEAIRKGSSELRKRCDACHEQYR